MERVAWVPMPGSWQPDWEVGGWDIRAQLYLLGTKQVSTQSKHPVLPVGLEREEDTLIGKGFPRQKKDGDTHVDRSAWAQKCPEHGGCGSIWGLSCGFMQLLFPLTL